MSTCKWCRGTLTPHETIYNKDECDKCHKITTPGAYKKCSNPSCTNTFRRGGRWFSDGLCDECYDRAHPEMYEDKHCKKCGKEIDIVEAMCGLAGMCDACREAEYKEEQAKEEIEIAENLQKLPDINLADKVNTKACSYLYYAINVRTGKVRLICRSEEETCCSCCKNGECEFVGEDE